MKTRIDVFSSNYVGFGLGKGSLFEYIEGEEEKRPANAPLVRLKGSTTQLSQYVLDRRCTSKGRGSVYDPVFGICCHFCRF